MFAKKSLAAAMLLSVALAPASAIADNFSAFVDLTNGVCGLPDINDMGMVAGVIIGETDITVSTSQGGHTMIQCSGQTDSFSGGARQAAGFNCGVSVQTAPGEETTTFEVTQDSHARVTPSGQAKLTCHLWAE